MDRNEGSNGASRKTSTGLDENIAGLLCYLLGFVTGIIFLVLEKENRFVKFHALQSTILFIGIMVVNFILNFIPLLGVIVSSLISLASVILWIVLMVKAYQGEKFKLPFIGDLAENQL